MGKKWLKYVVAGVGGAIVGGPLGAAAAIGVVKGASVLMETAEDDEKKKSQIASEHNESVTEIIKIQEKREKLLAQDEERKQTVKNQIKQAQTEFKIAIKDNAEQDIEQNAQLAIALFAVGFAASSIDGNMSKDEMRELGQFIHGVHSGEDISCRFIFMSILIPADSPLQCISVSASNCGWNSENSS